MGKAKLPNILDHIATKYILTQNLRIWKIYIIRNIVINSVVLTSKIIDNYFQSKEVSWLSQRTENGNC